jgi:hypothetical protein
VVFRAGGVILINLKYSGNMDVGRCLSIRLKTGDNQENMCSVRRPRDLSDSQCFVLSKAAGRVLSKIAC